jgi:hypothetical protein
MLGEPFVGAGAKMRSFSDEGICHRKLVAHFSILGEVFRVGQACAGTFCMCPAHIVALPARIAWQARGTCAKL